MNEHNAIIQIDAETGDTMIIQHPDDRVDASVFGEATEPIRGGRIFPTNGPTRLTFIVLRRVFNGDNRVARAVREWTRTWSCSWAIFDVQSGVYLPGVYPSHKDAVENEVLFLSLGEGDLFDGWCKAYPEQ